MKILAIDPSSRVIGYAVLTGLAAGELIDGGLIKPSDSKRELQKWAAPALAGVFMAPELAAFRRIASMLADLDAIVAEHQPDRIAVEIPSGKTGTGAKNKAKGALTTYGLAAGMVLQHCRALLPGGAVPITERQWTRDRGDKWDHRMLIAGLYAHYDGCKDEGADLSDAIGLGRWCFNDLTRVGGIGLASSRFLTTDEHR